ncbi:MAG TPA: hypothetical protein VK833_09655, partial [Gillisia sp.]|nr:hypothetical protein [Gillisia sp.]
IITGVTLKFRKKNNEIRTKYGAIDESLKASGISDPTIQDVSRAIINIRQQKLPDPRVLGNSGSFFKNPIITTYQLSQLIKNYPEIPHYKVSEIEVKIPAGWLIDKAGLKGYREGDAGVHKNQALVLVNYGNATGKEILLLAKKVQKKIKEQFNIDLEPEVNIF